MAAADYRLCDVCAQKAFYDANLNYVLINTPPYVKLDHLGDWAVICDDCAKTHKCIIVERLETLP